MRWVLTVLLGLVLASPALSDVAQLRDRTFYVPVGDRYQPYPGDKIIYTYTDMFGVASGGLTVTSADSTLLLDTAFARRMVLALYVIPSAPVTDAVILEIQVRGHFQNNADSLGTFVWPPMAMQENSGYGPAGGDSLAYGHYTVGSVSTRQGGTITARFKWATGDYGSPRGLWLQLENFGNWFNAPWTDIRIRYLSGTAGGTIKVKGNLVCFGQ